jgi:high-affinity nickel permease
MDPTCLVCLSFLFWASSALSSVLLHFVQYAAFSWAHDSPLRSVFDFMPPLLSLGSALVSFPVI